jgi:nicotinate-nucleotide pyrophosphorylase (carboxylating)
MLDLPRLRRAVRAALKEDLGPGDVTSEAVVPAGALARGRFVTREPLVVAGLPVAEMVCSEVDPALAFRSECAEGAEAAAGGLLATVEGRGRAILAAERTALNFLQRLSGIATAARRLTRLVEGTGAVVTDTRKTVPGLRFLDRYAVRTGGAANHRAGLFDAVLIKDGHVRLAGGVGAAVRAARRARDAGRCGGPIEVEVGTLEELEEALREGAEAVLLDNLDPASLERAVARARARVFVEVSGGLREADLPRIAALGVQRISVGALTHSVRAPDIALDLEPL